MSRKDYLNFALMAVGLTLVSGQYKYRILQPPAAAPQSSSLPLFPTHSRNSRHYDTKPDLDPGPYLQKDNFFSSGFLEDLLGLGRPSKSTVQDKREIQYQQYQQHHTPKFPSFFSLPPPQHPTPSPPLYRPQQPTSKVKFHKNVPVKKYLPKTPYEYTVKGASTHYVDNNEGRYHTAPERPSPHPQTQQPPRVQPFSFDSMFVQSGNTKSSHEFSGLKQGAGGQGYQHDRGFDHSHAQHAPPPPDTSSMHKVTPFIHKPAPSSSSPKIKSPSSAFKLPSSTLKINSPSSAFKSSSPSSASSFFSVTTSSPPLKSVITPSQKSQTIFHPINHENHSQPPLKTTMLLQNTINHDKLRTISPFLASTLTPKTLPTSPPFTSFNSFNVQPNTIENIEEPLKKDVFQLFQKLPEKFSLVKDVGTQKNVISVMPFPENTIETPVNKNNMLPSPQTRIIHSDHSSNIKKPDQSSKTLSRSSTDTIKTKHHSIKITQPKSKVRQSFFTTTPPTSTSSSTVSSSSSSLASVDSSTVRRRGTVSSGIRKKSANKIIRGSLRTDAKLIKSNNNTDKKKTGFTSFPYRDSTKPHKSNYINKKQRIKTKTHNLKKLESLEDKQENRDESLQRLLDIAGDGWSQPSDQQHKQQQQQNFECPEPEGHFTDESDCTGYFRCVHNKWTRVACGAGLVWNNKTGQCDWEEQVTCHVSA